MSTLNQAARLLAFLTGPLTYRWAFILAFIILVGFLLTSDTQTAVIVTLHFLMAFLLMVKRTDKA